MFRGFIFLILFSLIGCKWLMGPDEELTLECKPSVDNRLRVDGYYYSYFEGEPSITTAIFLYKNGVVRATEGFLLAEMEEQEKRFTDSSFLEEWNNKKYSWGLFQIDSSKIRIQTWFRRNGPLEVLNESGYITSDTSFIIIESSRVDGSEMERIETIYRFKKFTPKPDSVSQFVCNEMQH